MSRYLREVVEKRKQHYIKLLMDSGVFNIKDQSLHHYTLTQLEKEYERISDMKKVPD
ncbi:putative transcriptional regulator [Pullulanibacillus pueri]|uniref:Fur-regulated basic protein FbpA n=1 Tax=Pullulanibacillus pueri TaxID=1437324 RepID=A0A8J2ZWP6_9BACL|nr:Fur-regulated basic protein FbpA [Pullulanibacillus pueri]MBM7680642.1 putative transcriptional regulator [Pullulanibacillus pueri]GGH83857.1 hypothetical protein GCM10007096_25590 [Pullulanibacillus pueri]